MREFTSNKFNRIESIEQLSELKEKRFSINDSEKSCEKFELFDNKQ